jgi:tetratricopeptide (TPR) repeat protein
LLAIALSAGCATLGALESIESLLKSGQDLFAAGRYDDALAKFQEVIKRDPKSWSAYLYAARVYLVKQAWSPAIENGRKAMELAPNRADAIPVLAEALSKGGRDALARREYGEAITRFGEYVRLKPTDASGYLDLGRAYLGSGRYADTLGTVLQGFRQGGGAARPELTAMLLDGGRQALGRGDLQAGIAFLREYVQRDPGQVSAYLDLGKALWQSGQQGEALTAFREALRLQPSNQEALQYLLRMPAR